MAEEERAERGAGAGGREHQAEAVGRRAEVVVDPDRQQDLGRAEEDEQRGGGHDQRRPQPGLATHERRGFADLHAQRLVVALVGGDPRAHRQQAGHRGREGRRVDQQRPAGVQQRDRDAAEGRARQAQRDRPQRALQRVGLHEQATGHELGDDRAHRRPGQSFTGAEDEAQRDQVPDLQHAAERQPAGGADGHEAQRVGDEQLATLVIAVGQQAAREQEADHPQRPRQADQRQRAGAAAEVQDRERERHEVDPVAQQRHQGAGPEQREVSLPKRPDQAHDQGGRCHTVSDRIPSRPCLSPSTDLPEPASPPWRALSRARSASPTSTPGPCTAAPRWPPRAASTRSPRCEIAFDGDRVLLDGEDVTRAIRTPAISEQASGRGQRPEGPRGARRPAAGADRRGD